MAKFEAESYIRHRISYPAELFRPLASFLGPRSGALKVLDLGAGTGLSIGSLLQFYSGVQSVTLVDPDSEMLSRAVESIAEQEFEVSALVSAAEDFRIPEPVDLILIGSAWHWMNTSRTMDSLERALKPGGAVFVFEYQFPKAIEQGKERGNGREINDWIRREFNGKWKELDQKPRGSLNELLQRFRDGAAFSFRGQTFLELTVRMDLQSLFGVIISQSRYLAYEKSLPTENRIESRNQAFEDLRQIWGSALDHEFVYRFQGVRFQIRNV